ncbi:MAG: TolC family protein [Planctomycetota bacterium]|nr:TolC family protein [Planctomycetota bacterium]
MAMDVSHQPASTTSFERPDGTPAPQVNNGIWVKRLLLIGGVLGLMAALGAVIPSVFSSAEPGPQLMYTVVPSDLKVTITEQGTLESSDNTEIKNKVRGHNTVTWVIPSGSVVKAGDELVRLDTKVIEETVSEQRTKVFEATATLKETEADLAGAQINLDAYLDGRYRGRLKRSQTSVSIAEANLRSAETMLDKSRGLFNKGYITELELEGNELTVTQAKLQLQVAETELDVLERYTKQMDLEGMRGNLTYRQGKLKADQAGLKMTESRRDRALKELEQCVVRAEKDGLVIYPTAAAWKDTPDITEGATVAREQVLLIMPDLSKMQIKVGIHESVIDRLSPGLKARVTLPGRLLNSKVSSVATITRPAGWWTGNVVKYDTIIALPPAAGLKPGMSAEVEIVLAVHEDVLTVPVAAVVESDAGSFCWLNTPAGVQRRPIQLGDNNDAFVIVTAGLKEGDQVVLNPAGFTDEEEDDRLKKFQDKQDEEANAQETDPAQETTVKGD